MSENPIPTPSAASGRLMLTSKWAQSAELVIVFAIPLTFLGLTQLLNEPGAFLIQAMMAIAIVLMIGAVWLGLKLRGQNWRHFGLRFGRCSRREVVRAILRSLLVFVAALIAFVVGGMIVMAIVGAPVAAEVSPEAGLRENLPRLILTLLCVYITASFGEEVIYRGFLMTRIAELLGGGRGASATGLVVSSIVFGLIHYQWGITGMVQTGFMGLALGLCYLVVRRNLWITILAHGYLDTILILSL